MKVTRAALENMVSLLRGVWKSKRGWLFYMQVLLGCDGSRRWCGRWEEVGCLRRLRWNMTDLVILSYFVCRWRIPKYAAA